MDSTDEMHFHHAAMGWSLWLTSGVLVYATSGTPADAQLCHSMAQLAPGAVGTADAPTNGYHLATTDQLGVTKHSTGQSIVICAQPPPFAPDLCTLTHEYLEDGTRVRQLMGGAEGGPVTSTLCATPPVCSRSMSSSWALTTASSAASVSTP